MNIKLIDLVDSDSAGLRDRFRDPLLINRTKTLKSVLSTLESFTALREKGQVAHSLLALAIGDLVRILLEASPLSASEQEVWSQLCEVLADVEKSC
jgi:hypothetical protein